MSVLMFCTPRCLDESMCVLVIGRGAVGRHGLYSLAWQSCCNMLQLSLPLSSLLSVFLPHRLSPAIVLSLISALPSKRQGADKPFSLWYKQEIYREVNLPYQAL